jgi:hypothetical protein
MCAIYLKQGDQLVDMVEQPYEAEAVLRRLQADYPNLLAGEVPGAGDLAGLAQWNGRVAEG